MSDTERLVSCALIRDGEIHKGFRSHSDLRSSLGDENPYEPKRTDEYGFWTSEDRFVNRWQAAAIGLASGQARTAAVELLSSEVTWDAKPKTEEKPKRKLYGKSHKPLFRV